MKKIRIPFEIIELESDSYHIHTKIYLPNNEVGYAVIDTGASKTVLDKHFVGDVYHFEDINSDMSSGGIGGDIDEIKLISPNYIKIEDFEILNPQIAIIDLSSINKLYEHHCNRVISGLIGSDFLVKYKAVIDYKKKQITFTL